ncbi:hypothetical protein [Streptomyces sp. AcE210]|uniref:hypothetical protein n=1 Tax=Streptomyces sp. AcE210 TaxID=2292703 RepID=UPI0023E81A83|nr:hypothetical protein [Streptomyces sp. AcE210]
MASLAVQFTVRRYVASAYWTAVVMVSVFGTMTADVLRIGLAVPYTESTPAFLAVLAAVFMLWYAGERTLSVHSIQTRRREAFYWAAALASFALGTAAGDLAATVGFGYLGSVVLFAAGICVPALAHRFGALSAMTAFWTVYIVTRPLGAMEGMTTEHPAERGGTGRDVFAAFSERASNVTRIDLLRGQQSRRGVGPGQATRGATSAHHQKVAALLIEAHRSAVHELLDNARYDQPTAIRLHSMAAQLGQSAGWNEFDNGHHGLAQARWHTATHAAYLAGDHDLGAGILADLAYQATWRAFPKEAVDILALAHSRTHSPAARALLHVRTARALTVLGDRTGTHRALTTATRELDQARPDTTPAWVSWMSPADLEADAGPCHLDLGQPATAAAAIDNGLDLLNGERDRTRAVFTVYRADAALAAHDIPQAAAHARTALDTARATQAARCLDLSTALLGRLQQHRHHPAVRELVEYAGA